MSKMSKYQNAKVEAGSETATDKDGERGFTILELLVVLVILGMLATLVGPRVIGYLGKAKSDTAAIQTQNLVSALELYRLDVGRFPSESDGGMNALLKRPTGAVNWNGPYVRKQAMLLDPWGNPYLMREESFGNDIGVYSLGADGQDGGQGEDADVTSW